MIFYGSMQFFLFSKPQNKAEFKALDDSEVICKASVASMTSTISTTSVASVTSTALFHQKIYST
jgi:hypothetical protein